MATTTQVTAYRSAGIPDDAVGNVGDVCTDTANRGTWVKQAGNTWAGGFISITGPVGPAQLSYQGVPPNTFGQNGNGATDLTSGNTFLKTNGSWGSPVGSILGPAGPSNLGTTGSSAGQVAQATNFSLTSTPQTMVVGNTTTPLIYQPMFASAFLGCIVQTAATGTTTFTLYDQTASAAVYSITCGANTFAQSGTALFSIGQCPLVSAHQYVWQISNPTSQTGGGNVFPIYATPSASASPAVSLYPLIGLASSTSITSTTQQLPWYGGTQSAVLYPLRTAGCYAVQAILTATGSTATTATATLTGTYTPSGGSASNLSWSPSTLTANGQPKIVFGPSTDTSTFQNGYSFKYYIAASTTITATLQLQILAYV